MLLLQNARIATENSPVLVESDVLIVEGIIQDIGPNLAMYLLDLHIIVLLLFDCLRLL